MPAPHLPAGSSACRLIREPAHPQVNAVQSRI